jgi:hypothetical protein
MSTTQTTAADTVCIPDETILSDGPFTALRYHFGMLLGVDDFQTEQRYHRAKMRLHNAWLHRAGIVWGLDVEVVKERREVRVQPGLALDPAGRELHVDVPCCLDLGAWYDANEATANATRLADGTGFELNGRVELAFCSCATRAVPAIADPCEGAESDTAYSRTYETVEIRFVPTPADPPGDTPYPRLRLLFGLDEGVPAGQADAADVAAARADVLAQAPDKQADALLDYFRHFADLDTADAKEMHPVLTADGAYPGPFPFDEQAVVVLANLRNVTLVGKPGEWQLTNADVDRLPRRAHVATATIQELLCGRVLAGGAGNGGTAGADAGGPRVQQADLDRGKKKVTFAVDKPLEPLTLYASAFDVTWLAGSGWDQLKLKGDPTPGAHALEFVVALKWVPATGLVRFIAHGTGSAPLLGADWVPLAGGADSPPGTRADGHDFVQMFS